MTDSHLLNLAEQCGARITGKPDGTEAVSVVFTPAAWRAFDEAVATMPPTLSSEYRAEYRAAQVQAAADVWAGICFCGGDPTGCDPVERGS